MKVEYPVQVGSMLYTMVEPHVGFEKEYNRWYERDHFYAGCMIGPYLFAGRRWVATRDLKDLRFPQESPFAKPADAGSYLSIYWHLKGYHAEKSAWSRPQVHWLYANDRGFKERTHVHTSNYWYDWRFYRDEDPVPIELALDHRYKGLVSIATMPNDEVAREEVDQWFQGRYLTDFMKDSPVASCAAWSAVLPKKSERGSPMEIPSVENPELVTLQLYFPGSRPTGVLGQVPQAERRPRRIGIGPGGLRRAVHPDRRRHGYVYGPALVGDRHSWLPPPPSTRCAGRSPRTHSASP